MKPELKQRWVEALRSGKYEQGIHYLKLDANGTSQYCCLGVLCEIAGKKLVPGGKEEHGATGDEVQVYGVRVKTESGLYSTATQIPASKTLEQLGLNSNVATSLAEINDDGTNFEEIAKYIEATEDLTSWESYDRAVDPEAYEPEE